MRALQHSQVYNLGAWWNETAYFDIISIWESCPTASLHYECNGHNDISALPMYLLPKISVLDGKELHFFPSSLHWMGGRSNPSHPSRHWMEATGPLPIRCYQGGVWVRVISLSISLCIVWGEFWHFSSVSALDWLDLHDVPSVSPLERRECFLTINVPLILKVRQIFFCVGKTYDRAIRPFWPLNFPERRTI